MLSLISSNIYFIYKSTQYHDLLQQDYQGDVSLIIDRIETASNEIEEASKLVQNDIEAKKQLTQAIIIAKTLENARANSYDLANFIGLSLPLNRYDGMSEIPYFFHYIQEYIDTEYVRYINDGYKAPNKKEVMYHLESFHEALAYMSENLDEELFIEGEHEAIKSHWNELMKDIRSSYPSNILFEIYSEQYNM